MKALDYLLGACNILLAIGVLFNITPLDTGNVIVDRVIVGLLFLGAGLTCFNEVMRKEKK